MIEKHLKLKTMNTITRTQLCDLLDSLGIEDFGISAASGGGTEWDFITYETTLADDDTYHWIDIWNEDGTYVVSYQFKRLIEDEEDEEFGLDTFDQVFVESAEDIIEFITSKF